MYWRTFMSRASRIKNIEIRRKESLKSLEPNWLFITDVFDEEKELSSIQDLNKIYPSMLNEKSLSVDDFLDLYSTENNIDIYKEFYSAEQMEVLEIL